MANRTEMPYVGPRTFEEKDSHLFFGREREARDLLSLVISEPLVLFYAQSGAGKSSLINTRLVPGLRDEGFRVLPIGRVGGELATGITQVENIFVFNLIQSLDQGQEEVEGLIHIALTDYLQAHRPRPASAADDHYRQPARVLIIDQFEEIVTTHLDRWQEREGFFEQLRQAIQDDPLLWVVLTIREDYVAPLDPYARWLPGKLRARFHMQRMGYQAALEAVKRPAAENGRPFAPGVAETLVDNLRQVRIHGQPEASQGQFVEPVQLQVVCYQLWENLKDKPTADITHENLRELGDVDTALAQFYEQIIGRVLRETGESEIALRNWFDQQLITETGTRGTVYQGSDKTGGLANHTVALLANQFLLRAEIRAGGTWYELVHDRFVEPILEANQTWRLQQSGLVQAALAWDAAGREEDNLYRGQQLEAAQASVGEQKVEPLVAEFLAASRKLNQALEEKEAARQRELEQAQALAEAERKRAEEQARATRRLGRLTTVLAVVFLLAVAGAILAWTQRQRAQSQEQIAQQRAVEAIAAQQTAEAEAVARATAQAQVERVALVARSGELAAHAQTAMIEGYPQRSLLLAVEAMNVVSQTQDLRVPAAEDVLRQALSNTGGTSLGSYYYAITDMAISPDGQWLVVASETTPYLWNMADPTASPLALSVEEGPISSVIISPDNRWLVVAGGSLVHVWDVSTLLNTGMADPAADPIILRPDHQDFDFDRAITISPDSRWLVAGEDQEVRVWDLTDLSATPTILPLQDLPWNVAISPDNHWLIATGGWGGATVWNLTDLAADPILLWGPGVVGDIMAMVISPDSRWLAAGGWDTWVWDLSAPDPDATFIVLPSQSFVSAMAFSPDSHWLATANENGTAHVWDVSDWPTSDQDVPTAFPTIEPVVLRGHDEAITSVSFSPQTTEQSRWLITGSLDRTARLWNLIDPLAEPTILRGHDSGITAMAVGPVTPGQDTYWIATGSADGTARLWDVSTLPALSKAEGLNTGVSTEPAPNVPNPAPAAPLVLPGVEGFPVSNVAISPDGRWLVVGSDNPTLHLWDLTAADASSSTGPAGPVPIPTGHGFAITALAIGPDSSQDEGGYWLVTGGYDLVMGGYVSTVRLWDMRDAPEVSSSPIVLTGPDGPIYHLALSPVTPDGAGTLQGTGGRWLAASSEYSAEVYLWDISSLGNSGPPPSPIVLSGFEGLAFSPDNHWLATTGDTVRLWDLTAADLAQAPLVLTGHQNPIDAVAFSPDSRWLATSDFEEVRLWDASTLPAMPVLKGTEPWPPVEAFYHAQLAFSPDGRWLVGTGSADNTVRLWDMTSPNPAEEPLVLTGHERNILALAVSPDSHWLVTGSFDGTARLWDLTAPDPTTTAVVLRGHTGGILDLTISPDSHWLVTGSLDGTARLWTLWPEELVDLACRTAGRNFTSAERAAYFSGQSYRNTCPKLTAHPSGVE